jgi:predicted nucleotidyltransferase component of viral defense system
MIPVMNIIAWSSEAPWAEQRQIEQDLIISRAIVELFSDEFLRSELRFRGGTALNKLHFPRAVRYSEDIDLVRTTAGPIKPVLRRIREVLEPWLGEARFNTSSIAPKLIFRAPAEGDEAMLRLKVEIETREREAYDSLLFIPHAVENPWFTGQCDVPTYSREEMLATKLRALLQRNKGRDLFDLIHALAVFDGLDAKRVVDYSQRYLALRDHVISRAQAEERMFAKLRNPQFLRDIAPLLPPAEAERLNDEAIMSGFAQVFGTLIVRLPGEAWARTEAMIERFGLPLGEGG